MKSVVWFPLLFLALVGCATSKFKSSPAAGSARAPVSEAVLRGQPNSGQPVTQMQEELTRSQKVVYGSYYVDFFATLEPNGGAAPTCFQIRIETDDSKAREALKWDLYLKRAGYNPTRVNIENFVAEPTDRYPLLFTARACADYAIEPRAPVYLFVTARYRRGIEPIRLEWYVEPK